MTSYADNFNYTLLKVYDEGFPLLMPRWGYVAAAFTLFLIGFFGFFLNLMVILLMFKDRQLWTPLNIILFNLVCSDFSVSILGNPLTLISALIHGWIFGQTMCVFYGFFMSLLGITSITSLTVISFERYLMVTRSLNSWHLSSKGAVLSIVFIWTYALALTTPPLMGWGKYVHEAANISCSVDWHEQSFNTLTYIIFLFAMGQILPFMIITFSYVNIIKTLRKSAQRLGRVSRSESRATVMVFIMIVSFTIAWTPYSLFALMEQFANESIVSPGAGVIPALVAKSSICYNPLIYVGMNVQFRQAIRRMFASQSRRKSSQTEKCNNTLTSPANKLSSNDNTLSRINVSETNMSPARNTPKDKPKVLCDDISEITNMRCRRNFTRNADFCTIQENKTIAGMESNSDINIESWYVHTEQSPELSFIDAECVIFSKVNKKQNNHDETNAYENKAFENEAFQNDSANENDETYIDETQYESIKMQDMSKKSQPK